MLDASLTTGSVKDCLRVTQRRIIDKEQILDSLLYLVPMCPETDRQTDNINTYTNKIILMLKRSLVDKVLELDPQTNVKKTGGMTHAFIISVLKKWTQMAPWGSLVTQPSLVGELQAQNKAKS